MIMDAVCYRCGLPAKRYQSTGKRGVLCTKCQSKHNALKYKENRKNIIEKAANWNKKNISKRNNRLRKKYMEAKEESVRRYGGKCSCGITNIEFLTIDHINNGGARDRRGWSIKVANIHVWLKKKGYPEGYQILCGSCNLKKEIERRRARGSQTWERNQLAKMDVLNRYGAVCICCSESDPDKLVMDHINSGGSKEKKSYPSRNVYLFLKGKEPDRNKFQVLCQNCNQAKAFLGQCSHIKKN
jgi:hypothetical protein